MHQPKKDEVVMNDSVVWDLFQQYDDVSFPLIHFVDECDGKRFYEKCPILQVKVLTFETHHPNQFEWP